MSKIIIIILVLLLIFFSFKAYNSYEFNKELDIPSKCYTNLQPSSYFTTPFNYPSSNYGSLDSYIILESNSKNIIINNEKGKEIFYVNIVPTGSMRPAIPDYSVVFFIKPDKNDLKVGDIVWFIPKDNSIVDDKNLPNGILHRIVKITDDGRYVTKGDNNPTPDYVYQKNSSFIEDKLWTFEEVNGKAIGVIW